jgi:hypothetical protein
VTPARLSPHLELIPLPDLVEAVSVRGKIMIMFTGRYSDVRSKIMVMFVWRYSES